MKTEWDYSSLAKSYVDRVDYARDAVALLTNLTQIESSICDIGAGAGHLTKEFANFVSRIDAVEPNPEMRKRGMDLLSRFPNIHWYEGTAESTGRPSDFFDLVTFGSSFNVCNRQLALVESHRLLKSKGHFACLWNHRVLEDPLQAKIEEVIRNAIPNFSHGLRRENQVAIISDSGLFSSVTKHTFYTEYQIPKEKFLNAWRSHATLQRQAGSSFDSILESIGAVISSQRSEVLLVPYETVLFKAARSN